MCQVFIGAIRMDSPFSSIFSAFENKRSQIASAMVGSPRTSCHAAKGRSETTTVDCLPQRSSSISRKLRRSAGSSFIKPKSSSLLAHVVNICKLYWRYLWNIAKSLEDFLCMACSFIFKLFINYSLKDCSFGKAPSFLQRILHKLLTLACQLRMNLLNLVQLLNRLGAKQRLALCCFLFHRHALGKVARLVHIRTAQQRCMIGQQLHGNSVHNRRQHPRMARRTNHV